MSRTRAGLLAGLMLAAGGAYAARAEVTEESFHLRTTGDLVALCSPAPTDRMMTAALNFCHGYATGTYRALAEMDAARRGPKLTCLSTAAPTRNDAVANFVTWARARPDRLALAPLDGVVGFVRDQYPCPSGR